MKRLTLWPRMLSKYAMFVEALDKTFHQKPYILKHKAF